MSVDALWACGVLGKAHGLGGDLYLNLAPRGLEYLRLGERFFVARASRDSEGGDGALVPCCVERVGGMDERPLVRLDLAGTRAEAVSLQGGELLAAGGDLEAIAHYRVGDLLGMRVVTASGGCVGEVSDVLESPAHELLEVRRTDGGTVLIPLVEELVAVDENAGIARVADGFLDEMSPGT